jgi:hypothetical protein
MMRVDLSESRTLSLLDDLELEACRLAFLRAGDERFEAAVVVLCVRAVPIIELVCRERGADRGLGSEATLLAVEDAAARLVLRLHRLVSLPPVGAIAAQFAATCADAQPTGKTNCYQLAVRRAHLTLVHVLGDDTRRAR